MQEAREAYHHLARWPRPLAVLAAKAARALRTVHTPASADRAVRGPLPGKRAWMARRAIHTNNSEALAERTRSPGRLAEKARPAGPIQPGQRVLPTAGRAEEAEVPGTAVLLQLTPERAVQAARDFAKCGGGSDYGIRIH